MAGRKKNKPEEAPKSIGDVLNDAGNEELGEVLDPLQDKPEETPGDDKPEEEPETLYEVRTPNPHFNGKRYAGYGDPVEFKNGVGMANKLQAVVLVMNFKYSCAAPAVKLAIAELTGE
jgi:hypothetical protein